MDLIGLVAREDALFRVGDELQSIYGFRNADVDVFRRARDEAARQEGRVTPLTANWRSDPEILRALNRAFDGVFDEFTPLEPPPTTSDGALRGRATSSRSIPTSGPPPAPRAVARRAAGRRPLGRALEGEVRAARLGDEPFGASLAGVGQPWRAAEMRLLAGARQAADRRGRASSRGDIVVLCRATGDLPRYERALEERGVKTYLGGRRRVLVQQQVADLRAYLSVLANPLDEESLYFVLASPMVGASLDALAAIGLRAKRLERHAWWTLEAGLAGGDGSDGLAEALGGEAERIRDFVLRLQRRARPLHRACRSTL